MNHPELRSFGDITQKPVDAIQLSPTSVNKICCRKFGRTVEIRISPFFNILLALDGASEKSILLGGSIFPLETEEISI
ncbi:MAG: hypothetical protein Kow00127_10790 [Bacteroidales bacterium]